jgi:hypothetical protein
MRRFANSSCPVCTHTHSFVLNHLRRSHLRRITSFAGYSAPRVHQTRYSKDLKVESHPVCFHELSNKVGKTAAFRSICPHSSASFELRERILFLFLGHQSRWRSSCMHDRFFLVWLTSSLVLIPAAWAGTLVVFVRCFRFDVSEQQSTTKSLTETHTRVERTRLSVLSRPVMEKLSSTTYFETHFIEAIERLSNIALRWKSAVDWMRRVLGLQSLSDQRRTIDVAPSKAKVQIAERKRIDDKRNAS